MADRDFSLVSGRPTALNLLVGANAFNGSDRSQKIIPQITAAKYEFDQRADRYGERGFSDAGAIGSEDMVVLDVFSQKPCGMVQNPPFDIRALAFDILPGKK